MKHTITAAWQGNMLFDTLVSGHHIPVDVLPEAGGEDKGARPKQLLLAALAGCTGMDVVSILKKMRVDVKDFRIAVEGNLTGEVPTYYDAVHLIYEFTGTALDEDKLKRAVELSQDRYCGVSLMLRKALEITYEIKVHEETKDPKNINNEG
jgi:putative redox protein